jgi:hypothetical protein
MPIDFDALRGDSADAGVPADGVHTARLERVVLRETANGERLITDWSSEECSLWTSWNRFDPQGMSYTQDLLDGLGIDRKQMTTEDGLSDALATKEGGTYQVRTSSQKGSQGDRWFTSTYIEQAIAGRQETLDELAADTRGLPERDAAPAAAGDIFGDDAPVPF